MSTIDYILLWAIKIQLLMLMGIVLVRTGEYLWKSSRHLFLSVRYYFNWRPTIRSFAQWKQNNQEVIMLTTEGKYALKAAVDHLDGRYNIQLRSTRGFVADELVRIFDLPKVEKED